MSLNVQIEQIISDNIKSLIIGKSYSHRAVGDALENSCSKLIKKHIINFTKSKSKQSVDDFTILENNTEHLFDVKSRQIQKKGFSMPNLISIKRLKKIICNPNKTLNYILIDYERMGNKVTIAQIKVLNICEISWSNLTIGALGYGQLQIQKNNHNLEVIPLDKDSWGMNLNKMATNFYIKQIAKFEKQIKIWNS